MSCQCHDVQTLFLLLLYIISFPLTLFSTVTVNKDDEWMSAGCLTNCQSDVALNSSILAKAAHRPAAVVLRRFYNPHD